MKEPNRNSTRQTAIDRRRFLAASGVSVAGLTGIAGCLGNGDDDGDDGNGGSGGGAVADADPIETPVDSTAINWDDLGDLEGEINVYSGRKRSQIDLVFKMLEEEYDGLTINRSYDDNDAQVNQLIQEGDATPADVFYSQDPGALGAVHDEGLVQQLPSDVVDAVPESYREPDGFWTGVSGRVRSIQYNSERWDGDADDFPTDIFEYATDPQFEGIISTRPNSGTFRGFIQAMVELEGEETTRQWIRDFMDQDPQLFSSGGDQAAAVNRGGDDDPIVALGNSYYAARIVNEDSSAPLRITFTEDDAGCLFSVAGVAVTNNVDDPELIAEFTRHLVAAEGQEFMMETNGEYPVVDGVEYVGPLPDLDELNPPQFNLSSFDMELQAARELLEEEGMLPL
ncbi:extracellular solute-binding protein [Natronorubrum thiooxidans]|nr:extracellular solute-binding protein [Natronorubrum thiooxidans]